VDAKPLVYGCHDISDALDGPDGGSALKRVDDRQKCDAVVSSLWEPDSPYLCHAFDFNGNFDEPPSAAVYPLQRTLTRGL